MAQISIAGDPVHTIGNLPEVGSKAKDFTLVKNDMSEVSLKDYAGKKVILNIFPSIDTPTCANSTRVFNAELNKLDNTVVLCVCADLPFANNRFCGAEGLENVIPLSVFRNPDFGKDYGVLMTDGRLKGLLARAVVIIDENGTVTYTELVPDIKQSPNFEEAIKQVS